MSSTAITTGLLMFIARLMWPRRRIHILPHNRRSFQTVIDGWNVNLALISISVSVACLILIYPPPPHAPRSRLTSPHTLFCMSHVFVLVVISCYCNFLFPGHHLKCIPCLSYVPSVDGKCRSTRKYSSSFWFNFYFIAWFLFLRGLIFFNIPVLWNCFFLLFEEWRNIYNSCTSNGRT
jgi:hypothetical protein